MSHRDSRGFTLFEVLAAVAILGLFYTVLASSAIQGLRAEGTSRRRLEASLLADRHLSDLEAQAIAGSAPEVGRWEEEEGPFRVTVDVTPFDLTLLLGEDAETAPGNARGESGESLLDLPQVGEQSFLRTLEVSVYWTEGVDEKRVQRTSFAYDVAAAAPLFATEDGGGSDAAGSEDTGEEGTGEAGTGPAGRGSSGGGSAVDAMWEEVQRIMREREGR